jgi:hypothetical protein
MGENYGGYKLSGTKVEEEYYVENKQKLHKGHGVTNRHHHQNEVFVQDGGSAGLEKIRFAAFKF